MQNSCQNTNTCLQKGCNQKNALVNSISQKKYQTTKRLFPMQTNIQHLSAYNLKKKITIQPLKWKAASNFFCNEPFRGAHSRDL